MRNYLNHLILVFTAAGVCLVSAGCQSDANRSKVLAESFAGPLSLPLREEIRPSKTVATAKHGDKLDVIATRRRFVKVRTGEGVEGWTEARHLMTAEDLKEIEDLARRSASLPSQGLATVYEALNVHSEPQRESTSFQQIEQGMKVEVLAQRTEPRIALTSPIYFQIPKPAPPSRKAKKKKEESDLPPPPKPPAPALPADWLAISRTKLPPPAPENKPVVEPKEPQRPVRMDQWTLVRMPDGNAGWVLANMLVMAIPDEVAQYSEGKRITSYFDLGGVMDTESGEVKHNWLWTTIGSGDHPYQFDSFRVFIWNKRRHRYETAYIERNLKGYYPVEAASGGIPSFSLITEDQEGQIYKRKFVLEGYLVRMVDKQPWDRSPVSDNTRETDQSTPHLARTASQTAEEPSFADRVVNWTRKILQN